MPQFEVSSDTRFLLQTLEKAEPGETITYESMSEAIGRDVRRHALHALYSALRMVVKEHKVFEAIPNVGYRRLTDSEIIKTQADKGMSRIRRTAKRTALRVSSAQVANLNNNEKVQMNTQLSMMGAIAHMSRPSELKVLEEKVRARADQLPIGETLSAMTK